MNDEKFAVVTGVSTGIGYQTTRLLIERGFHVFGTIRKRADAERLVLEFGVRFTPLELDIRDESALREAASTVRAALHGARLTALVNNAGIASGAPLLLQPIEEIKDMFDVNVIGTIAAIQAFAPLLGADASLVGAPGRIVNISSIGGRVGFPYMGGYAGTKFAIEGFSESLRRELRLFGIDVVVIAPHSTNTPMLEKAERQGALGAYAETPYRQTGERVLRFAVSDAKKGLHPGHVANIVYEAITSSAPRARYSVAPKPFEAWLLSSLLPTRWVDRLLWKQFGFERLTDGRASTAQSPE